MALILVVIELAIGLAGFVGWVVIWYVTVTRGEKLLRPLFGDGAQPICLVGYPFFIGGLILALVKMVPRDSHNALFVVLGLLLTALGLLTYWNLWKGKIRW